MTHSPTTKDTGNTRNVSLTAEFAGEVLASLPMSARLRAGRSIDRYVIDGELGVGGMGVVYLAYDPELARKVAVKLLLSGARRSGVVRFRREAQAVAQLSHPNVVSIFDVGVFGGELFVAMEYVDGPSLRAWLAGGPRAVGEILNVFAQAARGLAAAHGAGLVHRDFKPANVLIGRDCRVRVADFGLARLMGGASSKAPDAEKSALGSGSAAEEKLWLDRTLTRTGVVLGTPRYMSPEQHLGGEVDARADQFAFCVALYEALTGERAFAGSDYSALAENVATGAVRGFAGDGSLPEWLRNLVLRGLEVSPDDRFASMDALLAELERDRRELRLSALDGSSSTEPMFAAFPPPEESDVAKRLAELRSRLEEAWGLKGRGNLDEAISIAQDVAGESHQVDYLPLRAAALYTLGNLQHRTGDSKAARSTLYLAAQVAAAAADDWQVANVWVFLVGVLGVLDRHQECDAIARVADVAITRLGNNASLRSRLYNSRGRALLGESRHDEAARQFELAIGLDERTHGRHHPFLGASLVSLSESLLEIGHAELAEAHLIRASAIWRDADRLRPAHAWCEQLLGRAFMVQGKLVRAREQLAAARALWTRLPERVDDLVETIAEEATCCRALGDSKQASQLAADVGVLLARVEVASDTRARIATRLRGLLECSEIIGADGQI